MAITRDAQLLEAVAEFNDCADAEILVSAFMKRGFVSEKLATSINEKMDVKKGRQVKFTLLKMAETYYIYINEAGSLSWCDATSRDALSNTLNEIKHCSDDSTALSARTYALRRAVLVAGRGILKSYDVFMTLPPSEQSKNVIKRLIRQEGAWTAQRVQLHENILGSLIKDARDLSEQIISAENIEKGLFCVRGSVASGKSTFVKVYLQQKLGDAGNFAGVINTDAIKRRLIQETADCLGIDLPGYLFHDEASMISDRLLSQAKKENLLYFVDKRMQEDKDLEEIISDDERRTSYHENS
jgi:hypothetical protein